MLGSHNSFSYLTPTKWWGKLLKTWTKCQDKTIEEQYNAGVRYFDVRVAYNKAGSLRLVHNCIDLPLTGLYEALSALNDKGNIFVRVILDMRRKPKKKKAEERLLHAFNTFVIHLTETYPQIIVDKAIIAWNWDYVVSSDIIVTERHASVSSKWYEYLLGTKHWAKKHNQSEIAAEQEQINSSKHVLLLDYV